MVQRSRCTAALLLPGRAAAKYAIPQPAPIAQLDRASDYESEGRVFESPWAHSVFRVVSTRLRVGCVARLEWTSRAGVHGRSSSYEASHDLVIPPTRPAVDPRARPGQGVTFPPARPSARS